MFTSRNLSGCLKMALLLTLILPFSATAEQDGENDPLEGFNRAVFAFNETADRYVLRPVASGYRYVTPDPLEDGVGRAFDNAGEVVNVANSLLQGKLGKAANHTGRFLINSTFGLLGFIDVAKDLGMEKGDGEDFGQTLGAWGVGAGPYVVLPFLGPSTLRDAPARFVDSYGDTVRYVDHVPTRNSLYGLRFVSQRAQLMEAEKLISGDKYLFTRDVYLQRRRYLVNDGQLEDSFGGDYDGGGYGEYGSD